MASTINLPLLSVPIPGLPMSDPPESRTNRCSLFVRISLIKVARRASPPLGGFQPQGSVSPCVSPLCTTTSVVSSPTAVGSGARVEVGGRVSLVGAKSARVAVAPATCGGCRQRGWLGSSEGRGRDARWLGGGDGQRSLGETRRSRGECERGCVLRRRGGGRRWGSRGCRLTSYQPQGEEQQQEASEPE